MTNVEPAALPQGDPKALLDAYRAMNNGALPPGMTPEQAMLIDMGMWTDAVTQNPQLLTILQGVASQRLQQQQDFAAGRAQVGQNYQQLTGDVAQQGTNWMADLMQRMGISPTAAQYDPNITGYGETIANMTETADQMQATDQAWFDKMAPVYDQNLATIMNQLATPVPPVVDTGSGGGRGGGGGGYGRRGYRGGGGSSGGDWSAPKTTDTTNLAQDLNAAYFNPGFQDAVLQMFTEPSDMEYAQQLLDRYGGAPRDVGGGIVKTELPTVTAALDAQLAQAAQRRAYFESLPVQAATALKRGQALEDQVISQNNLRENQNVRDFMTPEQRADYNAETATYFFDRLSEHFANQGLPSSNNPNAKWWPDLADRDQGKNNKLAAQFAAASQYLQQERGKERLKAAQQAATGQDPFSYSGWTDYVEPVSQRDIEENEWAKAIQEAVLGMAREYNPNYDWQVTKMTQQDSADYKTTQNTRNPEMAVFDNRAVEGPPADVGAFDVFTPFGESRGLRISADTLLKLKEAAAQRLGQKVKEPPPVEPTDRPNPSAVASRRPTVAPTGFKRVDETQPKTKAQILTNKKNSLSRKDVLAKKREEIFGKTKTKKKKK